MPDPADLVWQFHGAFGLPRRTQPNKGTAEDWALRKELIEEEAAEVDAAFYLGDLSHLAHELADLVYVAYGAAVTFGIDLDAVIAEVHRANMSKLGEDGKPVRRADGKVLKGSNFRPADVRGVLGL